MLDKGYRFPGPEFPQRELRRIRVPLQSRPLPPPQRGEEEEGLERAAEQARLDHRPHSTAPLIYAT
jgi:hypothetical protein